MVGQTGNQINVFKNNWCYKTGLSCNEPDTIKFQINKIEPGFVWLIIFYFNGVYCPLLIQTYKICHINSAECN